MQVWIGMGICVLLITFILRKILSVESGIYHRNSSTISLSDSFWSLIEFQNAGITLYSFTFEICIYYNTFIFKWLSM